MPSLDRVRALSPLRGASRRTLLTALAGVAALALVAVLVPVLLDGRQETVCRRAPVRARALADDPERAAKALDPGEDVARTRPLKRLLRPGGHPLCEGPDGTALAGRTLVAATTGRTAEDQGRPARPHTERAARVTHAVVLLLGEGHDGHGPDFPLGLAPHLARMFASYIQDTSRAMTHGPPRDDQRRPTISDREAEYPDGSGNAVTPFPSGEDIHVVFPDIEQAQNLIGRLAASPRAFATLYDAERARFAAYLERLTDDALEPGAKTEYGLSGTESELEQSAAFVARLMASRTSALANGLASSPDAFDRAVLRHTRGLYHAADHRVRSRPSAATLAQRRPDASPGTGGRAAEQLMDGRIQLFAVFDAWAKERGIPPGRAERLRVAIDWRYVLGLRLI
ncbi:hypothetical protein DTL70_20455 [Streptomyces diacarni]|uniref:Uncharacterized protein n=1 Tax=Streptomyces diacarni TaxID=2800381 RepID=A0A367ERF2_9ACTN|nr:hypothetical protein [Streptomyces diacarni]RCG20664.1 hypothetical protein DTL70_20455 [Streptomyces diacarni]